MTVNRNHKQMLLYFLASFRQSCGAGTYSTPGSNICLPCDDGYQCQSASDTAKPLDNQCDQGGWCDGELFHACAIGKYNPLNTSSSAAACLVCPAGRNKHKSLSG